MSASCRTGGARGDGFAPSLIPPSGQVPLARCVQTSTGTTEEVHRRLLGVECDAGEAAALVACTHAPLKPLHVGLWAVDQYRNALAPDARHRARRSDQRPATKLDDPLDRESQSVDMPTKHAHTVHAHFSCVCGECALDSGSGASRAPRYYLLLRAC